jgi:uncharacterized protein (TIGR04255 family)
MREKLKISPLVEATCELTFAPDVGAKWVGELSAESFGELVRDTYPLREQGTHTDSAIAPGENGEPVVGSTQKQTWRYTNPEGTVTIQSAGDVLSISHRKNYAGWGLFRGSITRALQAFVEVMEPAQVQRASLRYINHIRAQNRGRVRDYLCVGPQPPKAAEGRLMTHFYQRCDYTFDDGVLVLQSAIAKVANTPGVVLDLEFASRQPVPASDLTRWLDVAHDTIGDIFRTSLNPEYYEQIRRGET